MSKAAMSNAAMSNAAMSNAAMSKAAMKSSHAMSHHAISLSPSPPGRAPVDGALAHARRAVRDIAADADRQACLRALELHKRSLRQACASGCAPEAVAKAAAEDASLRPRVWAQAAIKLSDAARAADPAAASRLDDIVRALYGSRPPRPEQADLSASWLVESPCAVSPAYASVLDTIAPLPAHQAVESAERAMAAIAGTHWMSALVAWVAARDVLFCAIDADHEVKPVDILRRAPGDA